MSIMPLTFAVRRSRGFARNSTASAAWQDSRHTTLRYHDQRFQRTRHAAAPGDDMNSNGGQSGDTEVIAVNVGNIDQLFNTMDPSPFGERGLDPQASSYIIDAARELGRGSTLSLTLRVTGTVLDAEELEAVPGAIRDHFAKRSRSTRVELRRLLRTGAWCLLIGVVFVAVTTLIGGWIGDLVGPVLRHSFIIGTWVALWKPLEILLYDWWPMLADARLFDRLARMPVEVKNVPGNA